MPTTVSRLRIWFGLLALLAVAVVAGFYLRARLEMRTALRDLPGKLGIDIQQTSEGFTLSKTEGGRTLFTIHASKATQFKDGNRAQLHDVNITVYGRNADRFDRISGDDFEYDPKAQTVASTGQVQIDLAANPGAKPGGDQPEIKNSIHVLAEGLTFSQKTGLAASDGLVAFRMPQALGTARGASYDSKKNLLTLLSAVDVRTTGTQATRIRAGSGTITKEPRQITMQDAEMTGQGRTVDADQAVVHLAADNSMQRVDAEGNVRLDDGGGMQLRAPAGELTLGARNTVQTAVFTGGVDFDSARQEAGGHSGRMRMQFAPEAGRRGQGVAAAELQTVYADQGVVLRQAPRAGSRNPQALGMTSDAMTLALNERRELRSAETNATGQLTIRPTDPRHAGEETVIDARQFTADFGEENRLRTMHATGGVQATSHAPGTPDKVSTSQTMVAEFNPSGEISRAVQEGDFRYREAQGSRQEPGGRSAFAERASYAPLDESLTLTGAPRVVDGGTTVTADTIRLLRTSGELFATGEVKTTYSELAAQPNGALLASSDPVHVTAQAMNALQAAGLAHYTGGARLWQGSNIVEAQTIDFDQKARTISAQGERRRPVTCVFQQVDSKGKTTPMLVTAPGLTYSDNERVAHYVGGVTVKNEDGVMTAGKVDVYLNAAGPAHQTGGLTAGPSQLDRVVAATRVVVEQQGRRAEGEKLVYQAASGTYVLSGGEPVLTDPVNGTVRGNSLTFYSHDDRVIAEGGDGTRAVTHTHVSR